MRSWAHERSGRGAECRRRASEWVVSRQSSPTIGVPRRGPFYNGVQIAVKTESLGNDPGGPPRSLETEYCRAAVSATSSVSPSPLPLLVTCRLRPPATLGPDRIVRLASEAGFGAIAADEGVTREQLQALASAALLSGLTISVAACPLPESGLAKDKRMPYLAAFDDPEERRAAVKAALATMAWGQQLAIPFFTLALGPVPLRSGQGDWRLGYARRETDPDERGGKALRRALDERKARGQAIYDACRAGLEPLLAEAERRGSKLVVPLATNPWQLPTPREAHQLLQEFAGGPLSLVYSPAGRAVLEDLGLAGPPERWSDLAAATGLVALSDRIGLETNITLGVGDLEVALPPEIPADAGWLITGPIDATFKEVLRARTRATELREDLLRVQEQRRARRHAESEPRNS
jgi:hypothetical protein